jgi:hypothetical protein
MISDASTTPERDPEEERASTNNVNNVTLMMRNDTVHAYTPGAGARW